MVGLVEFGAAISSLRGALDLAKALKVTADEVALNDVKLALQRAVGEAQSSLLAAQEAQAANLKLVSDLEAKIAGMEKWSAEEQRYELKEFPTGVLAYVLKSEAANGEPGHCICPTCYQDGHKSLLQVMARIRGGERVKCERCGTTLDLKEAGPPQVIRRNNSWMV